MYYSLKLEFETDVEAEDLEDDPAALEVFNLLNNVLPYMVNNVTINLFS